VQIVEVSQSNRDTLPAQIAAWDKERMTQPITPLG
jgi:hypothetical protein